MGLLKWMARRGAVGEAARWAGRLYNEFKLEDPDIHGLALYEKLIDKRFEHSKDTLNERLMRRQVGEIGSLEYFVCFLLMMETRFGRNPIESQMQFAEVVAEELKKCGVPDHVIDGK